MPAVELRSRERDPGKRRSTQGGNGHTGTTASLGEACAVLVPSPRVAHATLAAWLGIPIQELEAALTGLCDAGIVTREGTRYTVRSGLSVDTRAGEGSLRALQRHWLKVALERAQQDTDDWFAYNVVSCSEADLQRIEDCFRRAYLESRAIVAASEPCETAALVLLQVARMGPRADEPRSPIR